MAMVPHLTTKHPGAEDFSRACSGGTALHGCLLLDTVYMLAASGPPVTTRWCQLEAGVGATCRTG